jgi:hypothetical protein
MEQHMRKIILAFLLGLLLVVGKAPGLANASPVPEAALQSEVTRNEVTLNFPKTATFELSVNHPVDIKSIVLEYGNQQQTCGEVIAKAFPHFTPGRQVDTEWVWDMQQSGSLPPGTQLWWRWRITDANGNETVTDTKTATWLDDVHPWQTVSNEQLNLHYYGIKKAFAQELLNAGAKGMERNKTKMGLTTDAPINIYVYPSYTDLQDAILYEPSWTGGLAFPEENIVILGTSGFDENYDKGVVIHELTHVVVEHFTFSCLGDVAHWLDEGLAMYSEGSPAVQYQQAFDQAIKENSLLSLRILSGSFGEAQDKADLSYAESYSIVDYLIKTYGPEKLIDLLKAFKDGATPDEALIQNYGFDVDGLEDAWRASIGAQPRAVSAQPTLQVTPTFVPTIVPFSGRSGTVAVQATPTAIPTSSSGGQPTQSPASQTRRPPLALSFILLGLCCVLILLAGIVVIGLIVRYQNQKRGSDVK